MRTAASVLKRFASERGGVAGIELAIIAPLVILCALCVADLGRFAIERTWVTYAASAGADYAAAHASSSFEATAVASAATSAAPVSGISISPTPSAYYGCATSSGVVTVVNGTNVTSSTVCPSATSTGGTAGQYVSVTATMPFAALFGAAGKFGLGPGKAREPNAVKALSLCSGLSISWSGKRNFAG